VYGLILGALTECSSFRDESPVHGDVICDVWSGMMPGMMYGSHAGAVADVTQVPVYQHHHQQFGL